MVFRILLSVNGESSTLTLPQTKGIYICSKLRISTKAWVSYITYIEVNGKICYICLILDIVARKVIAYKCDNRAIKNFVIDTSNLALINRSSLKSLSFILFVF